MRIALAAAACALLATPALALEAASSVDVTASPAAVWRTIGGFCGIADWHPAVTRCVPGSQGSAPTRTLTLGNGATLVEEQTARDDGAMRYSYTILEGPLPVQDYHSTLSVTPKGTGSTISWTGDFKARGASDADATKVIQGIYDSGLTALAAKTQS